MPQHSTRERPSELVLWAMCIGGAIGVLVLLLCWPPTILALIWCLSVVGSLLHLLGMPAELAVIGEMILPFIALVVLIRYWIAARALRQLGMRS